MNALHKTLSAAKIDPKQSGAAAIIRALKAAGWQHDVPGFGTLSTWTKDGKTLHLKG